MFNTPEFVAAEVAYRRERISAGYHPAPGGREQRRRHWHLPRA